MNDPTVSSFAAYDGDRLVALVADGLPEWSDDLSAVADADLATHEAAWLAEFDRLAADDADDAVALAAVAAEHVQALRTEAATRLAAAAEVTDPAEPDPTADPADPADPVEPLATDPPEPEPGTPTREEQIAALRATITPEPEPIPIPEPGVSREDLVEAVMAGSRAVAEQVAGAAASAAATAVVTAMREREVEPGTGRTPTAAELGRRRPDHLAPVDSPAPARGQRGVLNARLTAQADIPGVPMGHEINTRDELVDAFLSRLQGIGSGGSVSDEKIPIASLTIDIPTDRDIREMSWGQARRKVQDVLASTPLDVRTSVETALRALPASGGLSAPVAPYYEQLVIAQSDRPVRDDAMPTFVADRGGIKLVPPPSIGSITGVVPTGQFSDGVSATSTAWTSATAAFTQSDVGSPIVGTNIAAGTIITTVTNATTLVLSQATTGTASGLTFRILNRNPNNLGAPVGIVTAAQDAAGPPTTVKFTYDVPIGTAVEFDVYSVYTSLQFANLTARTFPEQVEAYLRVADALHARTADSQMLDVMTNYSTLVTGAKTFGTARQLLAQWDHLLAFYRNLERMRPSDTIMLGVPAWSINAMRGDFVSTFLGDGWGLSDDELISFFAERNAIPWLYMDGPTDVSQLFSTVGLSAAVNSGSNTATPIALPDYPGSGATTSFRTKVVSFAYAPGTFLALTTGELNLGLVRDSVLNSQNRFRNFVEEWETPAFVGTRALRMVHTTAADGTYGAAASITLGVGSGI